MSAVDSPSDDELQSLRRLAAAALQEGRFDLADQLLARGQISAEALTHNLRVYQAELEMQAHELRESNDRLDRAVQRFRRLFDSLPQPALVVDRLGVVQQANASADRVLGLDGDGLVKPSLRRLAADDASRLALFAALADTHPSGRVKASDVRLAVAGQRTLHADVYVERLLGVTTDEPAQYLVLVVDETDRIAAADELRQINASLKEQQRENRRLAAAVRSMQTMVVVTDAQRRVSWVNPAFERMTGWSAADLAGTPWTCLHGPGTDDATLAQVRHCLDVGEGFAGLELLNYTRDGTPFWTRLDVQPVRGDDGAIEAFVSVQTDVTRQRHVEADLREAEAFQRAVLDSAPVLIATIQPDGQIASLNEAAAAMLQLPQPGDGLGRPLGDFVAEADRPQLERLRARAILGESIAQRLTLVGVAGRRMPAAMTAGPVWHGGRVKTIVLVGRDISAEEALTAERAAREAAVAANQAKTRFLSQMSHELRTPLNAVLGFAQLIRSDLQDGRWEPAQLLQRAELIESAGWHLLAMINDVLDLSRIEAGRVEVHIEPVEVVPLVSQLVASFMPQVAERGLSLHWQHPATAPRVLADAVRLRQILSNLLSNAVKYNVERGRIEVSCLLGCAGEVGVAVRDSGPGLDAESVAHLFEPFNRLRARSNVQGTGIGLVIARSLAELMGGRIEVHSRPGEGSVFTVWMPEAPSAAHGEPASAAADEDVGLGPALAHPRRVLYVEDVESNIELMRQALADTAWSLRIERSGSAGLQAAQAEPPDLILLDLQLPDVDGVDVRRALLQSPSTAAVPCIAVTADVAARERGSLGVGFDDWLSKPLDLPSLRRSLARTLPAPGH